MFNLDSGVIVNDGSVANKPMGRGVFICDMMAMQTKQPQYVSLMCDADGTKVFVIRRDDMLAFADQNPAILLSLLKVGVLY